MTLPEIVLYNFISNCLTFARLDYNSASDKNQTLLADLFTNSDANIPTPQPIVWDKMVFLTEAANMFTRDVTEQRMPVACMGYNMERIMFPTVHIMLPQEGQGRFDSIGQGEWQQQNIGNTVLRVNKYYTQVSNYDLLITSDSTAEVILLYHFVKAMITTMLETLEFSGLRNIKMGGSDLQMDQQYAPANIFHRRVTLTFDYESQVWTRYNMNLGTSAQFNFCANLDIDWNNYIKLLNQQQRIPQPNTTTSFS